jgi:hypothetical protein
MVFYAHALYVNLALVTYRIDKKKGVFTIDYMGKKPTRKTEEKTDLGIKTTKPRKME